MPKKFKVNFTSSAEPKTSNEANKRLWRAKNLLTFQKKGIAFKICLIQIIYKFNFYSAIELNRMSLYLALSSISRRTKRI